MIKHQDYLIKLTQASDLQAALEFSLQKKFSGLITPVVDERNNRDLLVAEKENQCFTRSSLILTSAQWLTCVYPAIKISSDLDSSNEEVRKNYELKLIQEFNYALHIKASGLHYIVPQCQPEVLGKFLISQLNENVKFVVEIQLNATSNMTRQYIEGSEEEYDDSWHYWNELHKATGYSPQIEVALVMSTDLPDDLVIYRWLGEPVIMFIVPHNCFTTNKANFPILSRKLQEVYRLFMTYQKCFVVIEPKSIDDPQIELFLDYIKHQNSYVLRNESEEYQDSLRYPLQPLYDNLDSSTYETFERDPAKYILYQRAVEEALKDMIKEEEKATKKLIILLVGAGRGPLIRSCLNASANTGRKVKILAVEKNPNAIVTLTCLIRDLWADKEIELIAQDMRNIKLEENADIIVSELLGSVGDNELSPECLDGCQHLLKPTGISIPCNSISYLQPVMTKRIYGVINNGLELEERKRTKYSEATEVNWLVYLSNVFHIDAVQELFTFIHPNNENPIDNSRYKKLTFTASIDCVLHGFTGYFSSKLYKHIEISIVPETHTRGMASWYCALFPVSKPIQLKSGDKIEIEFWRKVDEIKVWYEWKVNLPEESIVHNLNGDIHPIFLKCE